jgi:hypothetical protein
MGYPLTATIPEDLHRLLQKEARQRGLSLAGLTREALLEKYAEKLEEMRQQDSPSQEDRKEQVS